VARICCSLVKIACLGWGSLVWKPGVLRCVGSWQPDGPALPLEFARTSQDGRLTIVLTAGAPLVPSLWVELDYATAEGAKAALAGREGSSLHAIGCWPGTAPKYDVGAAEVTVWAMSKGLDAVVWTALQPKFRNTTGGAPESADAAIEYLRQLGPEATVAAREYVERAPSQVRTTFRSAFEEQLGWTARS
jgi:hypothetical protein